MQQLFKAPHYLNASVKDVDTKQGIVMGYLASFNNLDSDNDIIMPGAFSKTVSELGPGSSKPRIKYLLDHDTSKNLGVFAVLKEDAQGLYYEAQAGTHALGIDYIKMVESGIITEHSIGYGVVRKTVINPDADWRERTTHLEELKLWEGSALQCWGANSNTPLVGMKAKIRAYDRAELILKELHSGTYTDKTFELLEKQLLLLQQAIKNSDETTEPELEIAATTSPNDEEKNLLNDMQVLNSRFAILLNN